MRGRLRGEMHRQASGRGGGGEATRLTRVTDDRYGYDLSLRWCNRVGSYFACDSVVKGNGD